MTPVDFHEANAKYDAPSGFTKSQVVTIAAYQGYVQGGSLDGYHLTVTAWKPSTEELTELNAGKPVFLSFMGGLPPHFATTRFEQAIHPA